MATKNFQFYMAASDGESFPTEGRVPGSLLEFFPSKLKYHFDDGEWREGWSLDDGGTAMYVDLTTDQSIDGAKTFLKEIKATNGVKLGNNNMGELPSGAIGFVGAGYVYELNTSGSPIENYDLVNKKYVDDVVSGVIPPIDLTQFVLTTTDQSVAGVKTFVNQIEADAGIKFGNANMGELPDGGIGFTAAGYVYELNTSGTPVEDYDLATKAYVDSSGGSGTPGPIGPQGPQGEPGVQGDAGIQGIQGDAGTAGIDGLDGVNGEIGADGVQGDQGVQGPEGPQGVQGIQGIQGQGFVIGAIFNSVAELLAGSVLSGEYGLVGGTLPVDHPDYGKLYLYFEGAWSYITDISVPGAEGIQGPAGADSTVPGPTGPTGADSTVPGPQGETGPEGPEGPSAVSADADNVAVLGTDSLIYVPKGVDATGLEAIDEGNGIGWALIGRDTDNYGNIGKWATDLSYSKSLSTEVGATGDWSFATGYKITASGDSSHAVGSNTLASGFAAHAEGQYTEATGESSHVEGSWSEANGLSSHAEGSTTIADGKASHAEGSKAKARGDYSHAEGNGSLSEGLYSHAEGSDSYAGGTGSHSEGIWARATGKASHAEGHYSEAIGEYSHAEGENTIALGDNSHAEGRYNVGTATDTIHEVGIGDSDTRKNAHEIYLDGTHTAPEATPALIDARGDKALITKEYFDTNVPTGPVVEVLTWAELVASQTAGTVNVWDRYSITDQGSVKIEIKFQSPDGMSFFETIGNDGIIELKKIA